MNSDVYSAIKEIRLNLLSQHGLGFFHWFKHHRNHLLPKIKKLEDTLIFLERQKILDDQNKMFILISLHSFLAELERFYSTHSNGEEVARLAKILKIYDENDEVSLKDVDKRLIDISKWFLDNRLSVKLRRIVRGIDPELEFCDFLGDGEFGVVLAVRLKGEIFALKIAKKNNEVLYLENPILGKFRRTLKDEFNIMHDLWNRGFKYIPRPVKFYSHCPCFEGEELGANGFLMELLLELSSPKTRTLSTSEYYEIQRMVDHLNSLGYVIPLDFKNNLKTTRKGLKMVDVIGVTRLNKSKEKEIKYAQSEILKELGILLTRDAI